MKTYAYLIGCLIPLLAAGTAFSAEPIGLVEHLEGVVTVESEEGTVNTLMAESPIFLNDRVITGAGAKVQIRFIDNTLLSQGELSDMTINEYVFQPQSKEDNVCSLAFLKGVFRVITDKITKINPDRFKVTTNYGTIGIRGCDLGFKVMGQSEEVYIIQLHHADHVVVEMSDAGAPGEKRAVVRQQGVVVALSPLTGLRQRSLTAEELKNLVVDTTPVLVGKGDRARAGADQAVREPRQKEEPASPQVAHVITGDPSAMPGGATTRGNVLAIEDTVATVVADTEVDRKRSNSAADPSPAPTRTDVTAPVTVEDGEATPGSGPTYPISTAKISEGGGSGDGWSWGLWSKEVTDLDGNSPVTRTTFGANASGSQLTAGQVDAIASGTTFYNLSGSGSAGAGLAQGNLANVISGSLDMNVQIGAFTPSWDATVDLSGGGDSLNFVTAGGISGGDLNGSLVSYSLDAFGSSYGAGSLSRQNIDARLVGTGTGPDPISGGTVKFGFEHGAGGPTVVGAGGANLDP